MVVECTILGRVYMRQQVLDDSLRAQKAIEEQFLHQGYAVLTIDAVCLLNELR